MRRRAAARMRSGRSARGWLTLLVLGVTAALIAVGPGTLRDMIGGLAFVRPTAGGSPTASTPHADAALAAQLQSIGASLSRGRFAASMLDVQSGASAEVDAERAYPAASLFKLPILIAVLAEEDAGRLDPDRLLQIREADWTDGSGVLQARVGDSLSVRELTRLMIQESDNIAALVLLDVVGVPSVNALMGRLGLQSTRLIDHRVGEDGDHTTSAADMARLLRLISSGGAVSTQVSEQALRQLELKQTVSWLGDGLPFWVKVAHKWGDLPDARNDAGIVFTPRGTYVAVVLTEGAEPDEAAGAISRASRLMYARLEH
jgi:beta-lactamase class A